MSKKRNNYHEKLEKTLNKITPLFNCQYIKIPDVTKKTMVMIRKYKRYDLKPKKRPFDAVLVTPNKTFCIEIKIDYDNLKPHQKNWNDKINKINNSFFVIRQKNLKAGKVFIVEHNGQNIYSTNKLEQIILFFKDNILDLI